QTNKIIYVEFHASDLEKTKAFFEKVFGWAFTDYGPDYTSFTDGRLAGGFFTSPDAPTKMNPIVVIFAADLEDAAARVARAGGKIVKPSFEFPGGRRFHFTDPTGLELSVWSNRRADGSKIA